MKPTTHSPEPKPEGQEPHVSQALYSGLEHRAYQGEAQPVIRSASGDEPEPSRRIEGYAVIFGVRSQILCSWGGYFEEIIEPSAITPELLNRSDVKALMEHNRERLLARSNKGQGTLSLSLDDKGLRYSFEAPNTIDGDTALELVRRGDIAGSSFAFVCHNSDDVERSWDDERKIWTHRVRHISGLYDVTLTSDPAYQQTSVSARSLAMPGGADPTAPSTPQGTPSTPEPDPQGRSQTTPGDASSPGDEASLEAYYQRLRQL